jgi:hypothetical protein
MATFFLQFFSTTGCAISTFSFLQWAGVTSTGLPTPTFHKSAQLEVISFALFGSCPIPFTYAYRNSAALSDFASGLPFTSTNSSFRNGLDLPAHLPGLQYLI